MGKHGKGGDKKNTHAKRLARERTEEFRGAKITARMMNNFNRNELKKDIARIQRRIEIDHAYLCKCTQNMRGLVKKSLISAVLFFLFLFLLFSGIIHGALDQIAIIPWILWILWIISFFYCFKFPYLHTCFFVEKKCIAKSLNDNHAKLTFLEQELRKLSST